ncbi:hypothetical protein ACRARG_12690 [Pseudooceanicola sp. C21-150M6]|uniref:hypothetical protein n=1 Tax=Pseudooceanicola sp. C21-150M6 TaxID=3434355 RepID=UPI003D7F71C6
MPHYHPDAIAAVTNPGTYAHLPWYLCDAWLRLKDQQGHPVTRNRLDRLDRPAVPAGAVYTPAEVIDIALGRALGTTRAAIRARGLTPTGGDAA